MKPINSVAESLYQHIDDEFEGRACKDITDAQCQEVPKNFFLILLALIASKLADTLASAKVVLPVLLNSTGAPAFYASLLVPIRESGSMLPQLFLGAALRNRPTRRPFLIASVWAQAAVMLMLLAVIMLLNGHAAGIAIVATLILMSLSRAITSITVKDVIGKTIPKARRGRQSGYAASIAGLAGIGFGAVLLFMSQDASAVRYLLMLACAAFVLCALCYGRVEEYAGATDGGVNGFAQSLRNLALLHDDRDFRQFVLVRALMMSSALVAPFFVLMAQGAMSDALTVGVFMIAGGTADFLSGGLWGKMADKNSKKLLRITAGLTALICGAGAVIAFTDSAHGALWSVGLFFLLSIVHQGVRQARKIYVIDMATGNQRTDYVSVSNTVIGVLLLVAGLITGVLATVSLTWVFLCFMVCSMLALLLGQRLKQVS